MEYSTLTSPFESPALLSDVVTAGAEASEASAGAVFFAHAAKDIAIARAIRTVMVFFIIETILHHRARKCI